MNLPILIPREGYDDSPAVHFPLGFLGEYDVARERLEAVCFGPLVIIDPACRGRAWRSEGVELRKRIIVKVSTADWLEEQLI